MKGRRECAALSRFPTGHGLSLIHILVVCGIPITEEMKNDIAVAQRLGITATTLEGILTVKGQGRRK